jgi:hypothetical protein
MSYILDVSRASKACLLIQNGQSASSEDIALFTYDELLEIINTVATGGTVELTNNEAPFSFNVTTQEGNIPKNGILSYNPSTHVLSYTKGDGSAIQNYTLSFNGTEILSTTSIVINGTTYPVGTSMQALIIAILDSIGINNIATTQLVNANFNNGSPLTGLTLPLSPINKDIIVAYFKDGIATYLYNGSIWSLVAFKYITIVKDTTSYVSFSAATSGGINVGEYFLAASNNLEGWIPNTLIKRTV